uniref:HORMA domain-containing protein 1 n=1 Tax=Ascaris suum TaxID=6253 RepID=F1L462_ASCSU
MEYNLYVGPYLARSTPKRKNVGWEATFPGAPEGKHSAVFMKRVVFALASDLLYRRRLLPPISFKRRQVEYLRLNLLDVKTTVGWAMGECLRGALEPLDFGYLKEIFIIVNTSSDHNNDEALEVYRFSFAYTLNAMPTSRKTTTSKRRVSYYGVDTVRMQIADAARHIYALADSLSVLPDGCHSTIKITYYDERTPEEYEPEGFIADSRLFRFIRPAKRVALGRVDCEQHACSLLVASIFIGNPWAMKMTLDSYYLSTSVRSRDSDTNQSGISNSELYPSFQKSDGLLLISPAHVSSRGRSASVNSSLCIAVEGCTINSLDTDVLEGGQESGSPRPTICGLAFAADKNSK